MNIKQIALECGITFETNVKSKEVSARVTEDKLEAFANALINDSEPVKGIVIRDGMSHIQNCSNATVKALSTQPTDALDKKEVK